MSPGKNSIFSSEQIVVSVRSSSVRSAPLWFSSVTPRVNYSATNINCRDTESIKKRIAEPSIPYLTHSIQQRANEMKNLDKIALNRSARTNFLVEWQEDILPICSCQVGKNKSPLSHRAD